MNREESTPANGASPDVEKNADLEDAHNKALAVSHKQREQLEALEAENTKLTSQLTAFSVKVGSQTSGMKSMSK
jgi:hypothetical protein